MSASRPARTTDRSGAKAGTADSVAGEREHLEEIVQIVKGSPQPEVSASGIADQIGVDEARAGALIDELVRQGRLTRDGERLIAIERAVDER
jgi:DNA-binding MarR family transcriptional regulator